MATTTRLAPASVLGRASVSLTTWALAVLLLAGLALAAAVGAPELTDSADLGASAIAVGLAAVSLQAAMLLRAPVSPPVTLAIVAAVAPAAAAAGLGVATGVTSVAVLVAAYAVVVDVPWPDPAPALGLAALLVALGDLVRAAVDDGLTPGATGAAALQGLATVGLGAAVGALVRARRETTLARTGRDLAVAGEQTALTQAAVARERVTMARELHDIAAHHLSGIAVMTGAIDRQIDTDPAAAKIAVRQVRQQSTAMLRDLRSLVSLLRDDDQRTGEPTIAPEALDGVPALVDGARVAGRDVELSVVGASAAELSSLRVGPLAQLAAYRTVQESLTNAERHAPGARCEVVIDVSRATEVVVTVRNAPPPHAPAPRPGGGFGIVGMHERADLTDARLTAGPDPDGGWTVTLTLATEPTEDPL
jgi:signal transduction histidine kinase